MGIHEERLTLPKILEKVDNKTIIFLDSHFEEDTFPLKKLENIKKAKLRPVIVIHDFLVPEENDYKYQYNSLNTSSGARRGVIYIYPKK